MKFRLSLEEVLIFWSTKDAWLYCMSYVQHKCLADRVVGAEFQPATDLVTNPGAISEFSWGECQTPSLLKANGLAWGGNREIQISHYNWNLTLIRTRNTFYSGCFILLIAMQHWKQAKWLLEDNLNLTPLFPYSYWNDWSKKIIENIKITYKA